MKLTTVSAVGTFRSCPRKYYYKYVLLRRPLRKTDALYFGQYMHQWLERWWRGESPAHTFCIDEIEDGFMPATLEALATGYDARYELVDDVVGVEQVFTVPIVNPATGAPSRTWSVTGKVDAVIKREGDIYIVEHKTTSESVETGSEYWQKLRMDNQVSTYMMAFGAIGCVYDVIKKPTKKPRLATPKEKRKYKKNGMLYANMREHDETPDAYKKRLLEDISGNPDGYFAREIIVRTDSDREEAAFDLWHTTKMIRECELADRWPRNPGSCYQWFRPCEYYDVCTGCGSIDNNTLYRTAPTEHEELRK